MNAEDALQRKIKQMCGERGLSVYQLAYRSGMSPSTIKNILYGKSKNPGLDTICKICFGFGTSLGDFFSDVLFEQIEQDEG